jgi:hypothetical protein
MHIERGRVWLAVTARSGKEAICGLLDSGAFLGEATLVGRGERLNVNPARLHIVHDRDRSISIAASAAIPQAPESEEGLWPLAG